ncbi:MAG: polysaccharide deacetylase family protein, partial [Kofleriaceae bacterium]|nr:polysaccharide deacetylase family protein [Kofleriaceae bacterium]
MRTDPARMRDRDEPRGRRDAFPVLRAPCFGARGHSPGPVYIAPMRARLSRTLAAVAQRGSGGRVLWHGRRDRRRIALTFDDGPNDLTPAYLDVLGELAVPATFFVMGYYLERRSEAMAAYRSG